MSKVAIIRRESFSAAHRLHCHKWSDDKNIQVFGKCNNPNFHGHNYSFYVKLIGEVDIETGMLINLKELSEIINREIVERFDHKNLNLDTKEFVSINPTVENIAIVIFELLRPHIPLTIDIKITIYETENNIAEYPA